MHRTGYEFYQDGGFSILCVNNFIPGNGGYFIILNMCGFPPLFHCTSFVLFMVLYILSTHSLARCLESLFMSLVSVCDVLQL